jgi:hypothetical protein
MSSNQSKGHAKEGAAAARILPRDEALTANTPGLEIPSLSFSEVGDGDQRPAQGVRPVGPDGFGAGTRSPHTPPRPGVRVDAAKTAAGKQIDKFDEPDSPDYTITSPQRHRN